MGTIDKQMVADTEQMDQQRANGKRSSLFFSIGRLFSKLVNKVKNKIIDFLAVNPMPREFPKTEKRTAKTQKAKAIGLLSLFRIVGKISRFLIKSTWRYVIKPAIMEPVRDIMRLHKLMNDPEIRKRVKKRQNNQDSNATCPKVHLEKGSVTNASTHLSHPESEFKSDKKIIAQDRARTKRENYKITKL